MAREISACDRSEPKPHRTKGTYAIVTLRVHKFVPRRHGSVGTAAVLVSLISLTTESLRPSLPFPTRRGIRKPIS